jgi:hypothetical protein
MPSFRKLSEAEIPANPPMRSARAQVAQAYDALLADFVIGDYGRVELAESERRNGVRSRLHVAARRRGLALRFRPGRGPLIFCVEAESVPPASMIEAGSVPDRPPQRAITPRRQHEERRPAGRYDAVLPRWMRAGQAGKRGGRRGR